MLMRLPLLGALLGAGLAAAAPSSAPALAPSQRSWDATPGQSLPLGARAANASRDDGYPATLAEVREGATRCASSDGNGVERRDPPLYAEKLRPQFHFSPSTNFMNDPNGLVYAGGLWHLFYQYNPTEPVVGNQHWGHAVSTDLYTWQNLPPAIAPANEDEGIFSGSAVIDANNTSGFFDDAPEDAARIVAIYTLNTPEAETQHVAYSADGIHFTKYNETVLTINSTQFRDPKVFWDEAHDQWVMTVAHPQEYAVVFYASPNLREWRELSRFAAAGLLGYQYECPGLFQVPVEHGPDAGTRKWVLINSINPGAPLGGSVVQYWVGDWDGERFAACDAGFRTADFGKDYYATQTWANAPDGRAVAIGWASNWQYTNVVPTAPWRSIQSVPRELTLKYVRPNPQYGDWVLNSRPVNLSSIAGETLFCLGGGSDESARSRNRTVELRGDGGFEISATFAVPASANVTYNTIGSFRILSESGRQSVATGVQWGEPAMVYIDRSRAGQRWARTNPFFTDKVSGIVRYASNYTEDDYILGPLPPAVIEAASSKAKTETTTITLTTLVDRSVIETFANGGELSGTSVFFFDDDEVPARLEVEVGDDQIQIQSLEVRQIRSTWAKCP